MQRWSMYDILLPEIGAPGGEFYDFWQKGSMVRMSRTTVEILYPGYKTCLEYAYTYGDIAVVTATNA